MITLTASWPASVLSPNNRSHWRKKASARKAQRTEGVLLTKAVHHTRRAAVAALQAIPVHIEFMPPDRRARDWDNLLASCKGLCDGIADGLGVDDRNFRISFELLTDTVKGGCVKVRLG